MYNEEEGIVEFLSKQLLPVLTRLEYDTEVVLVDDGSRDKTVEKVVEKYGNNGKVKLISNCIGAKFWKGDSTNSWVE